MRDNKTIPVDSFRDKVNTLIFIILFGTVILFVAFSFITASMSRRGYFQEGLAGLFIGTFLRRLVFFFCGVLLPIFLIKKLSKINRFLRTVLLFIILFWIWAV